jgi:hypothetical protein
MDLVRHARLYPHDLEGGVVPYLRTMAEPWRVADRIVEENPHAAYLMAPFMSARARPRSPAPTWRKALVVPYINAVDDPSYSARHHGGPGVGRQ